jgi:predicted RNA-binding Zn ribbon-like protein
VRRVIAPAPGERDHPALALVNTRYRSQGDLHDDLADPDRASAWLHARDDIPARLGQDDAAALRALRDATRSLLIARLHGGIPPRQAMDAVNAAILAAPSVAVLDWPAAGPERQYRSLGGDRLAKILARYAADTVALLTGPDGERLTACGAPGCVRLLVRTHGKRQWCSTRCGDRVRAARHYARRPPRIDDHASP